MMAIFKHFYKHKQKNLLLVWLASFQERLQTVIASGFSKIIQKSFLCSSCREQFILADLSQCVAYFYGVLIYSRTFSPISCLREEESNFCETDRRPNVVAEARAAAWNNAEPEHFDVGKVTLGCSSTEGVK